MTTYLRYRQIRRADNVDDQQGSAAIAGAIASSTTSEDYQVYFLSRLRQVIFGNPGIHHWYEDFLTEGLFPLKEATYHELLDNEPVSTGTTYSNTKVGSKVTQEKWIQTVGGNTIKTIDYTYSGNRVTTEVRKVFDAPTGLTIVAQVTITYSYAGSTVTGDVVVRNV